MSKKLALIASLLSFHSIAQACPGGDLLKIVASDGTLIASYDIRNGKQVASNRTFKILSVLDWERGSEISDNFMRPLCKARDCSELQDFDKTDIQVIFVDSLTGQKAAIIINNVAIGHDVPIAKCRPAAGK